MGMLALYFTLYSPEEENAQQLKMNCNVQKTTAAPPVTEAPVLCTDNRQACGWWSRIGECQKNPGYMLKNCKKSCGVC